MLLKKSVLNDKEDKEDIIEAIYDSTNLLKSTYLVKQRILYIYFRKGIVYSYQNVDRKTYDELENSDSQGVYHRKNIVETKAYPFTREHKMLNFEIKNINEEIDAAKKLLNENKSDE